MADREDQSNLPPIPDGGLGESMPDWLRRPPAWRTLPDREIVVPEPEGIDDLPAADDSVIDPRTFLSDDDLPRWLRNLGRGRAAQPPVEGESDMTAVTGVDADPEALHDPALDQPVSSAPSRFVPTTPPPASRGVTEREDAQRTGAQPATRSEAPPAAAWQAAWVVAVLTALLAVAIAVIVVLVM